MQVRKILPCHIYIVLYSQMTPNITIVIKSKRIKYTMNWKDDNHIQNVNQKIWRVDITWKA